MILGIGIDTVDIERFAQWHTYSHKTLSKIFSHEEINYCLNNKKKAAERFAVRFAAKEAFYKAISSYTSDSFFKLARLIITTKQNNQGVLLSFDWNHIEYGQDTPTVHVSLSHSKYMATAFVILEKSPSNSN